jgi:5-methylcytosine-specific restriction endonuclease McrA
MKAYDVSHLGDQELLRDLAALTVRDRCTTGEMLAHIAEVDARRLYAPAGYPSMHAYCVHELHLSEDAASKRIHAARAARDFPAIFDAVADGRLHLSGVCLLAPHLNRENALPLLEAGTHKTKAEIERLLAERFPRTELLPKVEAIPAAPGRHEQHAPAHAGSDTGTETGMVAATQRAVVAPPSKVAPIASQRFALHVTIGQSTHDQLRYAQELLRHQIPSGDVAEVIGLALHALVAQLEKAKFAATRKPRNSVRPTTSARHVPNHVKRAVWERDGGRCTFVSDDGKRCDSRDFIELDHLDPVARGGRATIESMRLLCRAHNQYEAERTFGVTFMEEKRRKAGSRAKACVAPEAQAGAKSAAKAGAPVPAKTPDPERDVTPWLRRLGFRADEARRAAAHCESLPEASLEERVRAALSFLRPGRPSSGRGVNLASVSQAGSAS